MKLLVLRVFLPNEFASADECENAVVPLTKELAQSVLSRRKVLTELRASDAELFEGTYWSRDCQFFTLETIETEINLTEEEQDDYDSDDWVIVEREKMIDPEKALRMEMIMMRLYRDSVLWRAMPKHEDIYVETSTINYEHFEEAL